LITAHQCQIVIPVAQRLDERSTLEISGTGVWAGRPRPWYRSSSLSGPSQAPGRPAETVGGDR